MNIKHKLLFILLCLIAAHCGCQKVIEQRKQYYYNKGMELYNAGNYIGAARQFGNALQFDQRYYDAQYMLCMSYYNTGDYLTAFECFQQALAERPDDIRVKLKIGECWLTTGKRGVMIQNYFTTVIAPLAEKNLDARLMLLKFKVYRRDLKDAEKIIDGFLQEGNKDSRFYALLTQFYLVKDKVSEAEDIALKHFSYSPDWIKAIELILEKFKSVENYDGLEKVYSRIIEQAPDKLSYQEGLAKVYRLRGEAEKESKLVQEMLQDNPDVLQVKKYYMNFLIHYNRQSQAETFIKEEINRQPENIELKKSLIDFYVQVGQTQKAFKVTEEMLQAIPQDTKDYVELQDVLADLHFRSGEYGRSKKIVKEILKEHPLDRDARFLLSKIYLQEKIPLSAIGELRQLSTENPNSAEFNYYLGLAHAMRGESILAEKAFRAALDSSPNYKEALKRWVEVYPKNGSLSEVKTKLKKYLELNPGDKEIIELSDAIDKQNDGILSLSPVRDEQLNSGELSHFQQGK